MAATLPSCGVGVEERPDIIFVLIDTLRSDHLGVYGFEANISPNLDALAAESFVFENCFSQAPWTPPSIGTLFTSLDPQIHGLNRFEKRRFRDPDSGALRGSVLPDEAYTLAEALGEAGYNTVGIVSNPWVSEHLGLAQGFAVYDDSHVSKRARASVVTDTAWKWLEQRPLDAPFFLYLHLMDVHEPYESPRRDYDALWPTVSAGTDRLLEPSEMPPEYLEVEADWADDEMRRNVAYWRTRYATGVRVLDRRLKTLLVKMERSGLLDESWIVVTSDHGEELFDHSGWGHGINLHDHQLRVPLFIRPPGGLEQMRRIDTPVRLIDLMPTLLSIAKTRPRVPLHGSSLLPLFDGQAFEPASAIFATGVVGQPETYSLRTDRYKIVLERRLGKAWLYDVIADPGEQHDIAEQEPEVVAELWNQLETHLAMARSSSALEPDTVELPDALQERLRALGYVD